MNTGGRIFRLTEEETEAQGHILCKWQRSDANPESFSSARVSLPHSASPAPPRRDLLPPTKGRVVPEASLSGRPRLIPEFAANRTRLFIKKKMTRGLQGSFTLGCLRMARAPCSALHLGALPQGAHLEPAGQREGSPWEQGPEQGGPPPQPGPGPAQLGAVEQRQGGTRRVGWGGAGVCARCQSTCRGPPSWACSCFRPGAASSWHSQPPRPPPRLLGASRSLLPDPNRLLPSSIAPLRTLQGSDATRSSQHFPTPPPGELPVST